MRAGTDGSNHALRFRRRKDKLHVLGRLFYELKQSVEALGADHVGFVDDEDLVAVTHRRKSRALTQVTRVIHTTVRGCVDFNNIE